MAYDFLKNDYYNILDEREYCSDEETSAYLEIIKNGDLLPENVHYAVSPDGKRRFYRYPQLNNDELISCMLLNLAKSLNSIRRYIEFFAGIAAIGLILVVVASCSMIIN